MIKKIFILLIIITSVVGANAQTSKIDSLENLLRNHIEQDTTRIKLLNDIAIQSLRVNNAKSYQYINEALELSDSLSYETGKARCLWITGVYHSGLADYSTAIAYLQKALDLYNKLGDVNGTSHCYNSLGAAYLYRGDFTPALVEFKKALKIQEQLDNKPKVAKLNNNIGVIYFYQGNYAYSLEYYQSALEISEILDDRYEISRSFLNIGIIYEHQHDYANALAYYQKALIMKEELNSKLGMALCLHNIGVVYVLQDDYTKALEYYQKGLEIQEELDDKRGIAASYNDIGEAYFEQGNYPEALSYIQKALKVNLEIGNKTNEGINYRAQSSVYYEMGKVNKAFQYGKKAYAIANETGERNLLKSSAELLAKSCNALGLYKEAYEYHVVFKSATDSLYNESNIKELTNLENQYAFDKEKQAINLEQQKKDAIQAEKTQKQKVVRNSFIGGFLLTLVLAIVILRSFLQKRRDNKILARQKLEIETINSKLLELDRFKQTMISMIVHDLKNPLNSILSTPADERIKHQARQMLNLVMNILDIQKFEDASMKIEESSNLLIQSINSAIEQISIPANEKNIEINNHIKNDITILADNQLIERVITNLLTNAIKYTPNNGKISLVSLDEGEKYLKVKIEDTGKGIPLDKQLMIFEKFGQVDAKNLGYSSSTGLGLTFCKLVVEAHGGEMGVESDGEHGSVFWFTLKKLAQKQVPEVEIKSKSQLKITLTGEEKEQLALILTQLQKLKYYEVSSIRKVLLAIQDNSNNNILLWKAEVLNAIRSGNELLYLSLTNFSNNEL